MSAAYTYIPQMHEHIGSTVLPMRSDAIKAIRKRSGLNSTNFASRIGVAETTLRRWESGRTNPQDQALRRVAEVFDAWEELGLEREGAPAWFTAWADQHDAMLREIRDQQAAILKKLYS